MPRVVKNRPAVKLIINFNLLLHTLIAGQGTTDHLKSTDFWVFLQLYRGHRASYIPHPNPPLTDIGFTLIYEGRKATA